MSGLRVHVSYDLAHDRDLHDRLSGQAKKPASFTVTSRSEGGEITSAWSERVRESIAEVDEVIVICGEHTDESLHVSAELRIAQEQQKPYVLLWGRRDSMCKKPRSARPDDGMYCWTPSILEAQLAFSLRRSRELEVPEGMKRQPAAPGANQRKTPGA
jgi:hypothetical protein